MSITIVNVGYCSTNYWVLSAGTSRLLVDLGYPGTMRKMLANLRRMDVPLGEIRYALATHYHLDHAGLAQELGQDDTGQVAASWQMLRERGATRVYPGHGPDRPMLEQV